MKCKLDLCQKCKENSNLNIKGQCECTKGYYYNKKNDECTKKKCTKKIPLCDKCNGDNICTKCKNKSIYDKSKNSCYCKKGFKYDYNKEYLLIFIYNI